MSKDVHSAQSAAESSFLPAVANLINFRYVFVTNRIDIFRLHPVRMIGYGFGLGEALRFRFHPDITEPFTLISTGFVLAHCFFVTRVVFEERAGNTIIALLDTFIWESLSSILIPPFLTFYVCRFTDAILSCYSEDNPIRRWVPVCVGIAFLFVIVVPVDRFVDSVMNDLIRPLYMRTY